MAADLKLESFSDRELLHILNDLADKEGWVESEHMISRLGLSPNGKTEEAHAKHVRQCIGVRLGWIRRLSATVERDPKVSGRWRLTVAGHEVVRARLTTGLRTSLEGIGDFTALPAIEALARKYTGTDPHAANLMRRQWAYGTHRNRRG